MKIVELKAFVVGNPPPAFGGRYFLFLKLKTACGIEGVGEVYAASFAPKAIVAMIEDVFERHVEGADPFRIETLWRKVYGRGYSGRPPGRPILSASRRSGATFTAAAIPAGPTFR